MWSKDLIQELKAVLQKLPEDMGQILERALTKQAGQTGSSRTSRNPRPGKSQGPGAEVPTWEEIGKQFLSASYAGTIGKGHRAADIAELVRMRQALEKSGVEALTASGARTGALHNLAAASLPPGTAAPAGVFGMPTAPTMQGGWPLSLSQMAGPRRGLAGLPAGISMGMGMPLSLSMMSPSKPAIPGMPSQVTMGGGMPLSLSHLTTLQALGPAGAKSMQWPRDVQPLTFGEQLKGFGSGMAKILGFATIIEKAKEIWSLALRFPAAASAVALGGGLAIGAAIPLIGPPFLNRRAEKILEGQRRLTEFSGAQAGIFANFDLQRAIQQRQLGDLTATTTRFLAGSIADYRQQALPRESFWQNLKNTFGIGLSGISRGLEENFAPGFRAFNTALFGEQNEGAVPDWAGRLGRFIGNWAVGNPIGAYQSFTDPTPKAEPPTPWHNWMRDILNKSTGALRGQQLPDATYP